jgi:SAM-dependent methyltransferase
MLSAVKKLYRFFRHYAGLVLYFLSGRKPWSTGYDAYKTRTIARICSNRQSLDVFVQNKILPNHFGLRLDERVVEYPWLLSRLRDQGLLLDAGSVLNFDYILSHPVFKNRMVTIYTLAPEGTVKGKNVSYLYGDLRKTLFRDNTFDDIVCLSTIEHVGMDNTLLYTDDKRMKEFAPEDYLKVVSELKRVLKPGGKLYITVPFGTYQNIGWMQQFDLNMVKRMLFTFEGTSSSVNYYRYSATGWQMSTAEECADCRYFDIHNAKIFDKDFAAAARAVACLELTK